MGTFLEEFLVKNFGRLPLSVRIFTYVFMLSLYAYLLLVPRFINGELLVESTSGRFIPYRSSELRMVVEGRVFKFKVNEDGVWSAPIISRLPHTVKMGVYIVDADAFADVEFRWTELWTRDLFRIIVSDDPPNVKVASVSAGNSIPFKFFSMIAQVFRPSAAWAGKLELPPKLSSLKVETSVSNRIRDKVFQTVAEVLDKDVREIDFKYPFSGSSAPSFVQKIEIIQKLEREFRFKIPDEHWNYLNTVGELVDYVQKRQLLNTKGGDIPVQPSIPMNSKDKFIQRSPAFKR